MGVRRSLRVLLVAIVVIAAACSSSDDDDNASDGGGGGDTTTSVAAAAPLSDSTIGITDDAINVAFINGDTKALAEAGLVPDIGDPQQDFEVFAKLANEAGGAAGRQIKFTSHLFPPGSTATQQQPACVQSTEDDQAALVIYLGGFATEAPLCVTKGHERIALAQANVMPQANFDQSQRRLFSHGPTTERLMAGGVAALVKHGDLEGKTIGIVRGDQADHKEAAAATKAALKANGLDVKEEVALPCENNACSQNETGVERLQAAGVDTVISFLGAIPYPTFIEAASGANFDPQWISTDVENQVFDVTAQFMKSVGDAYEGAIGITYGLEEPASDPYGAECMTKFKAETGKEYEYDTDAWRQVRNSCFIIDRIVTAAKWAQDNRGALNQGSLIEGFETLDFELGDQEGGWSATKHDAVDSIVLKTFGKDCLCWTEIEGTRSVQTG
jgi:ABC-type branched-subunit amino acid transport system substrate-binding protein